MQHHILAFDLQHWHKSGPQGPEVPLGSCVCGPHQTLLGSTDPAFSIYIMFPAVCSATMPMIYSFIYFTLCTEFAMQRPRCSHALAVCTVVFGSSTMCSAQQGRGSKSSQASTGTAPQVAPEVEIRQNKEGAPSKSSPGLGRDGKGDLDKRKGKAPQLSLVQFRISLGLSHWTGRNC